MITIGLGLAGYFHVGTPVCGAQGRKDAIITFRAAEFDLSLRSDAEESVYFYNGDFDARRGPDPVSESESFLREL